MKHDRMVIEQMWKGATVAYFKLLAQYLPGRTPKKYAKHQSE
jgi:hypothetical protein